MKRLKIIGMTALILWFVVSLTAFVQSGYINSQNMRVDGWQRLQVVGGDAVGTPPTSNPLYLGGSDGTNIQPLKVSTTGLLGIGGAANSGAAISGAPVRIAGSDGVTTRDLLVTATGQLWSLEAADTPCHITSAATTACKSTAGIVKRVVINTPIALATIKIFDVAGGSCTGTPGSNLNATITLPATLTNPPALDFNMNHTAGVCIVTSGATDITILYQ